MTEMQVLIYVDLHGTDLNEIDVEHYVAENADPEDDQRTLCIMGLSRLAGHFQIAGDTTRHTSLIDYLKTAYGLWSNKEKLTRCMSNSTYLKPEVVLSAENSRPI